MICFGIYCLAGIVNLASALFFKEGVRKISKCCLMPALVVFYFLAAQRFNWLIPAALVFSWAGDFLLIKKEKPLFFKLGLAAFLVSHIFYIIAFILIAGNIHTLAFIISIVVAIPLTLFILKLLKAPKPMKIPVAAYAVVIMVMSIFALQLMLAWPGFPGTLIFGASLVYLFSDTFMAYLLFNGKPKYFNFITMIPYIIAQGGIIMGLILGFGGR